MRLSRLFAVCIVGCVSACGGGSGSGGGGAPHTVGGMVTGLVGSGLGLLNNGADLLQVSQNGTFTFSESVAGGAAFNVTVSTQPGNPTQTCTVLHGSGNISGSDITNITVTCTTNTYSIAGTVTGLTGTGLVLTNGTDNLTVTKNGAYTFQTPVASGQQYGVTVTTQPTNPGQTCVPSNASGTVGASNVTNVNVVCTINFFSVGGGVAGLTGTGLTLTLNGGAPFAVTHNGQFSFPTTLQTTTQYTVAIASQPGNPAQVCTLSNASGSVPNAPVRSIAIVCPNPTGRFLYMTNPGTGNGFSTPNGTVSEYSIDSTSGALTAVGAALATGIGAGPVVLSPTGAFAYVANSGDPTDMGFGASVSEYTVNSGTGALTPVAGSPLALGNVGEDPTLAVAPSGQFAYVTYRFGIANPTGVYPYSIDPVSGALSPVAGGEVLGSCDPQAVAIDPSGQFLFTAYNGADPACLDSSSLAPFTISAATGTLTAASALQLAPSEAVSPLVLDPTGRFLYLPGPAPLIYGYAIDPVSGSLTAMPGSPFAVATAGVNSLSSDPAGRFLYISSATNPASPTVSIVIAAIDSATGALSSTNLAPTVISITSLGFADPVTFDPSGNFAYMILGAPEGLYGYTVDAATGALTAMSNPLAVGANPIWVAISN
jgi:6-phosphogluconolactonase (cycloisomerase 2 family)